MFHVYIFWKWMTLFFVSRIALEQSSNTIPIVSVLDVLAFLFLVVGIVTFLLLRPWQSTNSKVKLASSQMSMRQLKGVNLALPSFLAVPVIVLLVVWVGASTLPPASSPRSSPTVYISVVQGHTTPNALLGAIASELVTPHLLTVGTDTSYPPQTYLDAKKKPVGSDIDIIAAIAQKLGLNLDIVPMHYADLANSLNNRQLDVVISAVPLTNDVKKGENYVPYLNPADVLLVLKNNPSISHFATLSDLCGHSVSVLLGSSEDAALKNVNCGKNNTGITISEQPDLNSVIKALVSKTVDASYQDSPTSSYYLKNNGNQVQLLGARQAGSPEVILIRSGDAAMTLALQNAFNLVVLDQTYSKLLSKWNLALDQLPGTTGL